MPRARCSHPDARFLALGIGRRAIGRAVLQRIPMRKADDHRHRVHQIVKHCPFGKRSENRTSMELIHVGVKRIRQPLSSYHSRVDRTSTSVGHHLVAKPMYICYTTV